MELSISTEEIPDSSKFWTLFPFERNSFVRIGAGKCVMNKAYITYSEIIKNFEIRDDDVWVVGVPKSGTNWVEEMVRSILTDMTQLNTGESMFRFFERAAWGATVSTTDSKIIENRFNEFNNLPSPRLFKTHLPFSLLPNQLTDGTSKGKIIFVSRDLRDICVSYFHHSRNIVGFKGTMGDFVDLVVADKVPYAPLGGILKEFKEISERKELQGCLLHMNYEQMQADLEGCVRETVAFLGKQPIASTDLQRLCKHLDFSSMRNNPVLNKDNYVKTQQARLGVNDEEFRFIRKGKVGSWREELADEDALKLNQWIDA